MGKKWQRVIKISIAIVGVLLLAIQFVPVDFSNPPVTSALRAPNEVAEILASSCYDCHSNETRWPWYSKVAQDDDVMSYDTCVCLQLRIGHHFVSQTISDPLV